MAWRLSGTYFENCNCDMICPCTTSGLSAPADNERCNVALIFHVAEGDVNGVDVGGLSVALLADTPAVMSEQGWRVGVYMDAAASPEQAEALGGVFSGQLGGPLGALAPLIGEMLGMEAAPITFVDDGDRHSVRIGDAVDIEVQDFVSPFGATGAPVSVSNVGFPNDTLTAGRGTRCRVNAFGLAWPDNTGKNSFSSSFSWEAA
jgi:hypothetical protein